MSLEKSLNNLLTFPDEEMKMPVLFIGHGSPMNAIENNEFTKEWQKVASSIPKPKAIICISAHWQTNGTKVTAMPLPATIYDFYGFPKTLYQAQYNAPGSPELAKLTKQIITSTNTELSSDWGLDHGSWSILIHLAPKANIPVIQLSLDKTKSAMFHYQLAQQLKRLRNKGILIVGSGNIVHNLKEIDWQNPNSGYDWAIEFDEKIKQLILSSDHDAIVNYHQYNRLAHLAIPTNEHFLPLIYALALQDKHDDISFFADKLTLGSISMRSVKLG